MRENVGTCGVRTRARKPVPTAGFRRRTGAQVNSAMARASQDNGRCAELRGTAPLIRAAARRIRRVFARPWKAHATACSVRRVRER